MKNKDVSMENVKSISQLNDQIFETVKSEYVRPKQLMDQEQFNLIALNGLNKMVQINSKGASRFIVSEENEHFLNCVFAYLNKNEDDSKLIYTGGFDPVQLSLDKGLLFLGNFGIGKTMLMRFIHKNAQTLGLTGRFVTAMSIFETPKVDLPTIIGPKEYGLFIDDLGEEPNMSMNYGTEETPVARLLKERTDAWESMEESPKLFISSNLKLESDKPKAITLKTVYGGRVASRLQMACNVMVTKQKTDFRKS